MKLPNPDRARVDREKITDYLLCNAHPDGRSKAIFFTRFGFTPERWRVLAESLLKQGTMYSVVECVKSAYGTRYSVDGTLETPNGRNPCVRTVWIMEKDGTGPRLITAHPIMGESHDKGA